LSEEYKIRYFEECFDPGKSIRTSGPTLVPIDFQKKKKNFLSKEADDLYIDYIDVY